MLDQELLDGPAKHLGGLADVSGGFDEVGVHIVGEDIGGAHADGRAPALRHLAEDDAEVGDGVLDGGLKLAEVATWRGKEELN